MAGNPSKISPRSDLSYLEQLELANQAGPISLADLDYWTDRLAREGVAVWVGWVDEDGLPVPVDSFEADRLQIFYHVSRPCEQEKKGN